MEVEHLVCAGTVFQTSSPAELCTVINYMPTDEQSISSITIVICPSCTKVNIFAAIPRRVV